MIGVAGGIASGKSEVARRLAGPQGQVIDADRMAHEELASDEVTHLVRSQLGEDLLGDDGRPDRAELAKRVFADPSVRQRLEDWIHPRVRARILERLDEAEAAGVPRIVLDVPLLLEADPGVGYRDRCHAIVFVDAGGSEREKRAMRVRHWNAGEVARREASQLPLEEKRRRADFVISNRGTLEDLDRAVQVLLEQLG